MGTPAVSPAACPPVRPSAPEPLPAPPAHVELWVDSGPFGRSIGCRHSIGSVERSPSELTRFLLDLSEGRPAALASPGALQTFWSNGTDVRKP